MLQDVENQKSKFLWANVIICICSHVASCLRKKHIQLDYYYVYLSKFRPMHKQSNWSRVKVKVILPTPCSDQYTSSPIGQEWKWKWSYLPHVQTNAQAVQLVKSESDPTYPMFRPIHKQSNWSRVKVKVILPTPCSDQYTSSPIGQEWKWKLSYLPHVQTNAQAVQLVKSESDPTYPMFRPIHKQSNWSRVKVKVILPTPCSDQYTSSPIGQEWKWQLSYLPHVQTNTQAVQLVKSESDSYPTYPMFRPIHKQSNWSRVKVILPTPCSDQYTSSPIGQEWKWKWQLSYLPQGKIKLK